MAEDGKRKYQRRKDSVNLDTLGLEMGNKPPQALDVEEAVIGALLIEPSCVDDAVEELTPSTFYSEKHRMIYQAIVSLVNEHSSVDLLTVSQRLREQGNYEIVGGAEALALLSQKVGAAAHIEYYIKILKQKCIQRELITASYDILKNSYDESVNVDQLIDMAQTKIFAAIQNNVRKDVQELGSVINQAMADIERLQETTGLSGIPVAGQDNIRLAAFRPDYRGCPSFGRKDGFRGECRQKRRGGPSHAGGVFLSGNAGHTAGQAYDGFRDRTFFGQDKGRHQTGAVRMGAAGRET